MASSIQPEMQQLAKINNCKIVGQVTSVGKKIRFKCNLCKKENDALPTVLRKNKWCEKCEGHVKEERLIGLILEELKFDFSENYIIDDDNGFSFDYFVDLDPPLVIDYVKEDSKKRVKFLKEIFFRYIEIDPSADENKIRNELKNAITSKQDNVYITSLDMNKDQTDFIDTHLKKFDKKNIEILGDVSYKIDFGNPLDPEVKKIVSYARISTKDQIDGMSMDSQMSLAKEYASKNGFLKAQYLDFGLSGGKFNTRPAYRKLVLDCTSKDEVFVTDISRLGRNIREGVDAITDLRERNIYVHVANLNQSTNTDHGYLMITLYLVLSDSEKKGIIDKIKRTMGTMSNEGKLRSRPPFGWMYEGHDKPFVKNETEWKTIDGIRKLREDYPHFSINRICEEMDKDPTKYPGRKAKKWYSSTVKSIMIKNNIPLPQACDLETFVPKQRDKKKKTEGGEE